MPAIKVITPIIGGRFYHLFNRGINNQQVFFTDSNYHYFLSLLNKYLSNYCQFLSYCLIPNHFHLVIRINESIQLKEQVISDQEEIGKIFVNQLRSLLITYTMAINNQQKRTGAMFDARYKRLSIESEEYLKYLLFYCHYNPEKHEIVKNFRNYKFSSYNAFLSVKPTNIHKAYVLELFGDKNEFIDYHQTVHTERKLLILEE